MIAPYRTVPFRTTRTIKASEHMTKQDAVEAAQKAANALGDWCAVVGYKDGEPVTTNYVHPTTKARRR